MVDGFSHHGEVFLAAVRSGNGGGGRQGQVTAGNGEGLLQLEVVEACGFDGEMVGRLPGGESMAKGSGVRGELRLEMSESHAPQQVASRTD